MRFEGIDRCSFDVERKPEKKMKSRTGHAAMRTVQSADGDWRGSAVENDSAPDEVIVWAERRAH